MKRFDCFWFYCEVKLIMCTKKEDAKKRREITVFTVDFGVDLFVKFMPGFVCLLSWQQPLRKPQKCLCQHLCQLPVCPQVRTEL